MRKITNETAAVWKFMYLNNGRDLNLVYATRCNKKYLIKYIELTFEKLQTERLSKSKPNKGKEHNYCIVDSYFKALDLSS